MNENEIQVFMNEVFGEIRILEQNDGKVLFCGKDVALALKYSNTNEAITRPHRQPWKNTRSKLYYRRQSLPPDYPQPPTGCREVRALGV